MRRCGGGDGHCSQDESGRAYVVHLASSVGDGACHDMYESASRFERTCTPVEAAAEDGRAFPMGPLLRTHESTNCCNRLVARSCPAGGTNPLPKHSPKCCEVRPVLMRQPE